MVSTKTILLFAYHAIT